MKCKIEWLMTLQCEHHCIITNVTNKNKTGSLAEQGFALEQIQVDLKTEGILVHWIE